MKWQAIANVTGQINEEAKSYLIHKLQKDANVELPHLWSDFISETTNHLHDSQSNIEIAPNSKTGGLSCVTKFDELHPDFLDNNKDFSIYALDKYDKRAAGYLANVKNPFTRKSLQNKIGDYRVHLADNINHTEIKLIDGKRHMMAVESIEKLKNATYANPEIYQSHLQDCFTAINSLSLLPLEKEQLANQAQSELAGAAALGSLKRSPDTLINQSRLPQEAQPLWMQHLGLEQRIKLDNQLKHLQEHRQMMRQHEVSSTIKSNKASILATGESIKGIDNLIISAFGKDSRQFQQFKQDESLYKQAFNVTDSIKYSSFEEGNKILESLKPAAGDPDFYNKQNIYNIGLKQYAEQLKIAATDPAKFVEELYIDEMPQGLTFAQRLVWRMTLQQKKGIASYAQQYLTKSEKAEFLRKIEEGTDINEIRDRIDGIISLRDDNGNNYGLEVARELFNGRDSELFINLYAENKLYGNDNIASIFLKMIPYKGQLFNSGEESSFNKEISSNKVINKWEKGFYNQDFQNIEEINYTKQQIKYLASHYKKSGELSTEKAVRKATEEIIENRYMSMLGGRLQIPKAIIDNNRLQHLERDYIEANLSELKAGIINGSVKFDYNTSFGIADTAPPNEVEVQKLREVLSSGKWQLTPDKKSVYFTYLTKDGVYLPLMQKEKELLKFDLLDLNNPDALEHQKQGFLNALQNSKFEM